MIKHENIETKLLRKINREVMMCDFDPLSYQKALRVGSGSERSTLKNYTEIRIQSLKEETIETENKTDASSPFLSTDKLSQKASNESPTEHYEKCRRARQKWRTLENILGNIVLLIGSISSIFCVLSFSGNHVSSFPYLPIAAVIISIQMLPWIIKRSTKCSYLTAVLPLCIMIGCLSLASGVLLLKNNPKTTAQKKTSVTNELPTIRIIPPVKKASSEEGIAALRNQ